MLLNRNIENMKRNLLALACVLTASLGFAQLPTYVPTSGLIAWFGFTGNLNDSSGNNNNLTLNGGVVASSDRADVANNAYSFNGTSGYLNVPTLSQTFTQSGAFSFSIWIKPQASTTTGVAMMSGSSTSNMNIWNFQTNSTQLAMFGTNKQGSAWNWAYSPTFLLDKWEHYVGTYSNGSMTLYKNGVQVATQTNSYTTATSAANPLYIGRGLSTTAGFFKGDIDDIGLWNRVLTAAEINNLLTSTLHTSEVSTKETIALYPNPAKDVINIKNASIKDFEYPIVDANGRRVSTGKASKTINVSSLDTGVYWLQTNFAKPVQFIKE